MHGRRWGAALLVAAVLTGACSGGSGDDGAAQGDAGARGAEAAAGADVGAAATEAAEGDAADEAEGAEPAAAAPAADIEADGSEAATAGGEGGEITLAQGDDGIGDAPPAPAPGFDERIIKEGTISLEVEEDGFDAAFAAIVRRAQELGGGVVASDSRTTRDGVVGSVTVRVPVASYEDLLTSVGDLGTVTSRTITSQDVTGEFVDLESRLRHLQAQERFYLGLLEQAVAVPDAIAVQQQLDGIQSQVEQIRGRLDLLDDRTSFSTLTVELGEVGAAAPLEARGEADAEIGRLQRWWITARDAFVNAAGAILVVVLFLAPFALPAALVTAVVVALSRRSRRRWAAAMAAAAPPHAGVAPPVEDPVEREPAGVA